MALENYLGAMGILPDPLGAANQGIMNNLNIERTQIQNEAFKAQTAALEAKQQREALFRSQIDGLDPADPAAISRMMAQFPEYAKELKGAFDVQDAETKRNNLLYASQVYGAAVAGDYTRAAKLARQRYEADQAAGQADEDDLAMVEALESEDPKQRQAALAQLGVALAAEVGPDKFAQTFSALNQQREGKVIGDYLIDPVTGEVRFQAPSKPEYKVIDGNLVEIPGTDGFSSGGSSGDLFGRIIQQESGGQQFGSDGKPLTSSKGAIGIAQVMPATAPEAAQLAGLPWNPGKYRNDPAYNLALGKAYFEKQLSDFGDPALAAAAYNAGPGRVKAAVKKGGDNWINHVPEETRQYVSNVVGAPRASGAPRVLYSAPKQGYVPLTPQETAQLGLPEGTVAQRGPDGQINVINKPDKNGDDAPYSQSALDAFDRAIDTATRLKTHPGLQAAVGAKGITGGLLGGWIVPGTNAADFAAELDAMKAQVFLPMVQSMKGMGALSNAEGEKLTAAIGALDPKQSEGQFQKSLDRIISDLKMYRDRGAKKSAKPGGIVQVKTRADVEKLAPGTEFIGPDGKRYRRK